MKEHHNRIVGLKAENFFASTMNRLGLARERETPLLLSVGEVTKVNLLSLTQWVGRIVK